MGGKQEAPSENDVKKAMQKRWENFSTQSTIQNQNQNNTPEKNLPKTENTKLESNNPTTILPKINTDNNIQIKNNDKVNDNEQKINKEENNSLFLIQQPLPKQLLKFLDNN